MTTAVDEHSRPRPAESSSQSRVWQLALVACAIGFAIQSGFSSLSDSDLPTHLAIGEWILAHRTVPYVEPFAWTRSGAPYYAYSWLAQIGMFALLRGVGPIGLHVLAALTGAAVTFASAAAARALGLSWAGTAVFAVASSMIALESTPFLRPQLFMHVLVPLAWVVVAGWRRGSLTRWQSVASLATLSAIAANVHITFPVMCIPLVLLLADDEALRSPRFWIASASVAAGWMLSPYALVWPAVFRLNFSSNALTIPPALSGELTPGFVIAPLYGVAIGALPFVASFVLRRPRERILLGALWLVGLLLFARMFKGLGVWWWCATPLAVAALSRLPRASTDGVRSIMALLLTSYVAALAIPNVRLYPLLGSFEGDTRARRLPSVRGYAAEPAARWLERRAPAGARGRVLTVFSYGSYLQWRLPTLSESIDGRTIFPDSAALPDAVRGQGTPHLGPWRSADLAIVPVTYPVASLLDRDTAWAKIGVAVPPPWEITAPRAGLWVRSAWWRSIGGGTIERPRDGVLR